MRAPANDASARREAQWLGELIRSHRRGRYSIEALAQRSGISAGFLSELERGKGNPSYSTLLKLADALEIHPADFFRGAIDPRRDDHLVRIRDRQRMSFPGGRFIELLSPRVNLPIIMWRSVYPPGYDGTLYPETITAETSVLVTRGELRVHDADAEILRLARGDALRLESGMVFEPVNVGGNSAECIEASTVSPL